MSNRDRPSGPSKWEPGFPACKDIAGCWRWICLYQFKATIASGLNRLVIARHVVLNLVLKIQSASDERFRDVGDGTIWLVRDHMVIFKIEVEVTM